MKLTSLELYLRNVSFQKGEVTEIRSVVEYLLLDKVFNRTEFWMKVTETGFLGPGNMQKMYDSEMTCQREENDKSCLSYSSTYYLFYAHTAFAIAACWRILISCFTVYIQLLQLRSMYIYNNYTFTQCCCNFGTQLYFFWPLLSTKFCGLLRRVIC